MWLKGLKNYPVLTALFISWMFNVILKSLGESRNKLL